MTNQADDTVELRLVIPRDAFPVAARPDYFSQQNCDLLGLSKRSFLELLRRPDAPPVIRVGKQRLVRRDLMMTFLDGLAEAKPRGPRSAELDGPDQVLTELGCTPRRTP